jgi:ribosomal protein S18 acetylase RimI-like enzyme
MKSGPPEHPVQALHDDDVPALVEVAATVGWHPPVATWQWMLGMGEAWGIERGGALAGAVVVFRFGDALAMIAMMMVRPDAQRLGIGRALLAHVRQALPETTVSVLYASEEGERLYRPFGFVDAGASTRYEGTPRAPDEPLDVRLRAATRSDTPSIVALDEHAQGAPRRALVTSLIERAERVLVVDGADGVEAFGIAVDEDGARRLGPIVSETDAHAIALTSALAAGAERVRVDVEPGEVVLAEWLRRAGLEVSVVSPRLVLGPRGMPGRRSAIRAIAGRPFG